MNIYNIPNGLEFGLWEHTSGCELIVNVAYIIVLVYIRYKIIER